MSSDYKYDLQMQAEALAEVKYGVDFYSLSSELQDEVYNQASSSYWDSMYDAADNSRKASRENS